MNGQQFCEIVENLQEEWGSIHGGGGVLQVEWRSLPKGWESPSEGR